MLLPLPNKVGGSQKRLEFREYHSIKFFLVAFLFAFWLWSQHTPCVMFCDPELWKMCVFGKTNTWNDSGRTARSTVSILNSESALMKLLKGITLPVFHTLSLKQSIFSNVAIFYRVFHLQSFVWMQLQWNQGRSPSSIWTKLNCRILEI